MDDRPSIPPRLPIPEAATGSKRGVAWGRRLRTELRRHQARWFWVGLALFLGLVVWPGTRRVVAVLWVATNVGLVFRAAGSALGHLGRLWRVRGMMARWAFWPALIVTLLLRSKLEPVLAEVTGQWLPSGVFYATSFVVFMPFLFVAAMLWSACGAAVGALAVGRASVDDAITRLGIRGWWGLTWLAALLVVASQALALSSDWNLLWLGGVPLGTRYLQRLAFRWGESTLVDRFELWLARWFVWRRKNGRQLDMRGEALALVGWLLMGACVALKLFMPLQASALLSGIQFFNTVGIGRLKFVGEEVKPRGASNALAAALASSDFTVRLEPAKAVKEIVLLEWDALSLQRATTTNSEAGVQAELIRALADWGARRIVMPTPVIDAPTFSPPFDPHQAPAPRAEDFERTKRDLPELAAAMRQANNVLLLAPSRSALGGELLETNSTASPGPGPLAALSPAAREIGSSRFAPIQIAALPAIPFRWVPSELPPAPLLLFAALRGSNHAAVPTLVSDENASYAGRSFPLLTADPARLLVDFVTATRSRDFARVAYSSVFQHGDQFDANAGDAGAWRPSQEFFRDRIVFLQPLRSISQASPLGTMETTEVLAYGLRTLLGDHFVRAVSPVRQSLWALCCALVVGRMVVGRNPIKASWRLSLVLLAALGLSAVLFGDGVWLDPVFPSAAATAAFLLVTQLTFSLERTAKERNRFLLDRFVAPEVVTELLQSPETRLGLGGRRERVAVLFADVRGFTQFAENHAPEEVMKAVNAYLHVMTEALHQYGGILDKYTGDGLMALFRSERGVSVARAVECALAMRDGVLLLSADRTAGGDPSLQVGISLHVGEAVVGLVGNLARQVNFTALGHTVVVAARLQTLAGGGEVVVSEEVHTAAGDGFEMSPRATVFVKGVSHVVVPYLVERARSISPSEKPRDRAR